MPLTVIPAQAGIQYCQGQDDAIKTGGLDAGFRRNDGDNLANPCKYNLHFGFNLGVLRRSNPTDSFRRQSRNYTAYLGVAKYLL